MKHLLATQTLFKSYFNGVNLTIDFSNIENKEPENLFTSVADLDGLKVVSYNDKKYLLFAIKYDDYKFHDRYDMSVVYSIVDFEWGLFEEKIESFNSLLEDLNFSYKITDDCFTDLFEKRLTL